MTPTINHLPLNDEASGIRNLDARRTDLRIIDASVTLAIGMVIGALIVVSLFLIANL